MLKKAPQSLFAMAFRPGTNTNGLHQVQTFIQLHSLSATVLESFLCYHLLLCHFLHVAFHLYEQLHIWSRFLHKQLSLAPASMDSFPFSCLLRTANISMCTPPIRHPTHASASAVLMHSPVALGLRTSHVSVFSVAFLGILRQSNLAPRSCEDFDLS